MWAAHGDLVNVADRQYRTWRTFSRWAPVWRLFEVLPRGRRLRVAESVETRMRSTNLDYKATFPEEMVRRYAEPPLAAGHDLVVLGHFHLERDLATEGGHIIVLPAWRDDRRFFRIAPDGHATFETASS